MSVFSLHEQIQPSCSKIARSQSLPEVGKTQSSTQFSLSLFPLVPCSESKRAAEPCVTMQIFPSVYGITRTVEPLVSS